MLVKVKTVDGAVSDPYSCLQVENLHPICRQRLIIAFSPKTLRPLQPGEANVIVSFNFFFKAPPPQINQGLQTFEELLCRLSYVCHGKVFVSRWCWNCFKWKRFSKCLWALKLLQRVVKLSDLRKNCICVRLKGRCVVIMLIECIAGGDLASLLVMLMSLRSLPAGDESRADFLFAALSLSLRAHHLVWGERGAGRGAPRVWASQGGKTRWNVNTMRVF